MSMVRVKLEDLKPISEETIRRLESIRDEDIDYSDIPPLNPEEWKNAERGKFYRPRKEAISLRLDSDILFWLRSQGAGYQTRINTILREVMVRESSK